MAQAAGGDGRRERISGASAALAEGLSCLIGAGRARQVAEYVEHGEFGLALELFTALAIEHGLDGRPFDAEVEALAAAMGMEDSDHLAAWRRHIGGACGGRLGR